MDEATVRQLLQINQRLTDLERVEGGTASGTSFPSSWPNNVPFLRTDLGFLCYYDGTRWLTVHEYERFLFGGTSANTLLDFTASDGFAFLMRLRLDYAPYFTRAAVTTRVSTTNNGSNYWTVSLDTYNLNFGAGTSIYQFNTSADTVNTYTDHEGNPSTPNPSNRHHLVLSVQKSGSPGTLRCLPAIFYRLIVT